MMLGMNLDPRWALTVDGWVPKREPGIEAKYVGDHHLGKGLYRLEKIQPGKDW
jgi:hypothetical protein